jgi:hypothetical protein
MFDEVQEDLTPEFKERAIEAKTTLREAFRTLYESDTIYQIMFFDGEQINVVEQLSGRIDTLTESLRYYEEEKASLIREQRQLKEDVLLSSPHSSASRRRVSLSTLMHQTKTTSGLPNSKMNHQVQ